MDEESKALADRKEIKLLGNRVMIRPVMESTLSPSGLLYLPANEDKRTHEAEVVLVGDEVKACIKVGDRVVYEGVGIKVGGKFSDRTPGIKIDESSDFIIETKYISAVIEG